MRTQTINFPGQPTNCVFPAERSNLAQAISEVGLKDNYPVIVLIGGEVDEQKVDSTRRAIEMISRIAEDMHAAVICGGTDMGVMAEIGRIRSRESYKFPLIGVAPEERVTWPGGPRNTKFLWLGKQRWPLESHYSHFILVPGSEFGDESPWIVDTASLLSKDHQSVTILINGGEVSRKDIQLSLENGRQVIVLSRTGRLADELAGQPTRNDLMTVLPVNAEKSIAEAIQVALSINERREEQVAVH
jgi:TRPM family ion channel